MFTAICFLILFCCITSGFGDTSSNDNSIISLTFSSTVILQNVSSSTFGSTSKEVLVDSLTKTLDIDSHRISFLSDSNKQWKNDLFEINAVFKITSYSSDYPSSTFENSTELFSAVSNMLVRSANNHDFVRSIKYYAHLSNDDNLEGVSEAGFVISLNVEDISSDDDFSAIDTFGVVVAGIILFTILSAFCFFYLFCVVFHPKKLLERTISKNRNGKGASTADIESNVKPSETVDINDVVPTVENDATTEAPETAFASPKLPVQESKVVEKKFLEVTLGEINEYYPNKSN